MQSLDCASGWGAYAWLQVLLAHLAVFNSFGYINSFGIFQAYYVETLNLNPSAVSWIGSLQVFLVYSLGTISGRLMDKGYFHVTIAAGFSCQVVAAFTTAEATEFWQLFLSQGLLQGLGNGLLFCPVVALVSTYFSSKRAVALAFVACGGATGGLVFPSIAQCMLYQTGFPWTVRVMGFVMLLNAIMVVCFTRTREVGKESFSDVSATVDVPDEKSITTTEGEQPVPGTQYPRTVRPLLKGEKQSQPLIQLHFLKSPPYAFFAVGVFFCLWGIFYAYYYVRPLAIHLGATQHDSFNLLLVLNGVGIPGRIVPALLSMRYLGPVNTLAPTALTGSALLFAWIAVRSLPSLYVFVALFGLPGGGVQSLFPAAAASLSEDLETVGARVGLVFTIASPACLSGPPIAGAIVQGSDGNYLGAQVFGGVVMFVGAGFVAAARVARTGWVWRAKV